MQPRGRGAATGAAPRPVSSWHRLGALPARATPRKARMGGGVRRNHQRSGSRRAAATGGAGARFARAIPGITLALLAARPVRAHYVARMTALVGADVVALLAAAPPPRTPGSEREILAAHLFESPETLGDPARPR